MNEERFNQIQRLFLNYQPRKEITLESIPAPHKLAKYAFALNADVSNGLLGDAEDQLASGRFVLLHEPNGQDTWNGEFRCVTYLNAALDDVMQDDPTLPEHGWQWLLDSLANAGCAFINPSGTVTRSISKSFGKLSNDSDGGEIEIRASWTPGFDEIEELRNHLVAWCNLLEEISGLQPIPDGVASFRSK